MVRNKTIKIHCCFHLNRHMPRPGIHSKTFQEANCFGFGSPREPNFDALPLFGCLQNVAAGSRICCTRWYQGGLVAPSPTSDVQLHQPQLRCGQRLAPSARDKHHTLVSVGSPTFCASRTKLSSWGAAHIFKIDRSKVHLLQTAVPPATPAEQCSQTPSRTIHRVC